MYQQLGIADNTSLWLLCTIMAPSSMFSAESQSGLYGQGKVRIDYRPVHMQPLDDQMEYIPPKARTY